MIARRVIRKALRVFRRTRAAEPPPVWSGVYARFEDIPPARAIFNNAEALRAAVHALRETEREPMPSEAAIDHQVLALLVRFAAAPVVRVDDFGGGVGQSYAALRRLIPREIRLRHRVVELPEVVARGREIWTDRHDELEFATELSTAQEPPTDIVFAKGALQYFADYASMLGTLCSRGAKWVLLEKLSLVDAPTYATVQHAYGGEAPYWMFNVRDIERVAEAAGYRVVLRRRMERTYDQSQFAPHLRMERASSLLFERSGS